MGARLYLARSPKLQAIAFGNARNLSSAAISFSRCACDHHHRYRAWSLSSYQNAK